MSRIKTYLPLSGGLRAAVAAGFVLFEFGTASAQPTNSNTPGEPSETAAKPTPTANPDSPEPSAQSATLPASEPPTTAPPIPAPEGATDTNQNSAAAPPALAPRVPVANAPSSQPLELPSSVNLQLMRLRLLKRDRRAVTFGVGPLVLANVHWLDKPSDKTVTLGTLHGTDTQYPGFTGLDATLGLMLDVRYLHFLGVELDLFLQNDRGTGTINVQDAGSICFIPGVKLTLPTRSYAVTIGQMAWHVPFLFKLSLPGRWELVHEDDSTDQEIRRNFATLAFGPEFVFPRSATFNVVPAAGLDHPERAFASTYVMYTGALGFEHRLGTSHDIRLLFSARGSYNPSSGNSAMKRAEYGTASGNVVAVAYRSEWRYQAALTVGLGWFL